MPDCDWCAVSEDTRENVEGLFELLAGAGTRPERIAPLRALLDKEEVVGAIEAAEEFALCSIKLDQDAFLALVNESWENYQRHMQTHVKNLARMAEDKKKDEDAPIIQKKLDDARNGLAIVNVNCTRLRVKVNPPAPKEASGEGEGGAVDLVQAGRKKTKKKKKVAADEHEEDDFQANLPLWADKVGKTWEWRKRKQLNSEWKTIELRGDERHTCVVREGVKLDVTEEHAYSWQALPNHSFWGEISGGIALFSEPPGDDGFGKPIFCMSRRQFEEQYPAEMEASRH